MNEEIFSRFILAVIPHTVIIFQIYAIIWRCTGYILANYIVRQYKPRARAVFLLFMVFDKKQYKKR